MDKKYILRALKRWTRNTRPTPPPSRKNKSKIETLYPWPNTKWTVVTLMDSIGCGKIVDVHAQIGDMEVLFAIYQVSEECMDLVFW